MFKFIPALLLAVAFSATAGEPPKEPPLAYQLAAQPLALVDGNQCHVRGAIWIGDALNGSTRAGVNFDLVLPDNSIVKVKTNEAGIYAASIPYAGSPLLIRERLADPVFAPTTLNEKARLHSPQIECSQERTAAFLQSLKQRAKGGKAQ